MNGTRAISATASRDVVEAQSRARSLAYALAILFVFTVPWEAAVQIAGLGRGSRIVGLAAGLLWLASVAERGRLRPLDVFHHAVFAFVVWSGLTFVWTIDPGGTAAGFLTYLQIFLMVLMLWDLLDNRQRIATAMQAYVLGAFVASGSLIFEYLSAPPARFPAYERVNALGFQTDGIALIVAIAAPAAWYLAVGPAIGHRTLLLRSVNFAYLPVGLFALVLTGTRGAVLASIPTALLVLWSLRHARGVWRVAGVAALVAAVFVVIEFAPRGQLDRIATAATAAQLGDEEGALSTRWPIWRESQRVFFERPITGVGLDGHREAVGPALGQDRIYTKAEKEAHNVYLSVLVETGVIGFGLFALVIGAVISRLRRLTGWEARYWAAQLGVLAIGGISLSIEDSKSAWIFLTLAVGYVAAVVPSRVAVRRQPPVAASVAVTMPSPYARR